jgi:hypothetical protein
MLKVDLYRVVIRSENALINANEVHGELTYLVN